MCRAASLSVFLAWTTFTLWLLACWETSANKPSATTPEVAATESSGEALHLYTALDTNEAKIYIRAFEEESGIQVRWVRLSAGEVLVRIRSERNNPQVALWFGGPSPEFIVAKREGLLASYAPRINFDPPPGTFDEAHYWTGFYFGAIGFAS
ncbi:ABC transporter substrate-binding protein, partial [Candidatus Poribacteria bacterium]|nr:ABC transporter substrate-binding protein [Candidatus Poribacteria bacterium]